MTGQPIVSVGELARHLGEPDWAIFDCRFDLSEPGRGERLYQESHIPGAVYAHLERDLSGPVISGVTGRHPLPEVKDLASLFSSWGIGAGTRVTVYDDFSGSMASRLWWMLRWLGHESVAVLDGGWAAWLGAGLPRHSGSETRQPQDITPHLQPDMLADADEILRSLEDRSLLLVDSRAPERFRGESEPIDKIAGRIPDASNLYHMEVVDPDGFLLPQAELEARFQRLIAERDLANVVVYCGSGVTATHNLLALTAAGFSGVRLYAGSWSEWITDPTRPIEKGPITSTTDDH
jgi:thiosulfate/3-mercaptopyruvate sulfurtransferase